MLTHPPKTPHLPRVRSQSLFSAATLGMFLLLAAPVPAMAQMPGVTPVCDRTPEVRDEIVRRIPGVSDCADVTEEHLAAFQGSLSLYGPFNGFFTGYPDPIKELKEGDFSGLTSLRSIIIGRNELSTLPKGIFSGLAALLSLSIVSNQTSSLPEGIFSGLSSLSSLSLRDNKLTTLPEGIFSGLSSLQVLYLNDNQMNTLPEGTFTGLPALVVLSLDRNRLSRLPPGVFAGLSSLRWLWLDGNELSHLPEGLFAGLTSLEWLRIEWNRLATLPDGIFSGSSSMIRLYLAGNRLSHLPARVFSGLTSLYELRLHQNQLRRLPDGIFSGLTSLNWLNLADNPGDPLLVPVSLEWVEPGRFRARAPTGAPYEIELALELSAGSAIEGDSLRITIPKGHTESPVFSVSRSPDTASAVTVEIAGLPRRPGPHYGYVLIRSPLPLAVWESQSLDFAHFANGSSITSDLVIVNVGTQPVLPSIHFYDKEGDPIDAGSVMDVTGDMEVQGDGVLSVRTAVEPLGELTISTHGRGELVRGSARVAADGPIGGVLRFNAPGIGVAGVGSSRPLRDAVFPVRRNEGGINTGAAIRNLGEDPITVTCQLMQEANVLEEAEIPLEANGQAALFINELFPGTDTLNFLGSVRCGAPVEASFAGVALEMDFEQAIFTTLPVVSVPQKRNQDYTHLYFAHFANGSSFSSELVFVNVAARPIRPAVYFHDYGGKPIAPASVVDLGDRFQVRADGALTVRTAVAPLGELTISTHGRGDLVNGSVKVVADGPVGGFLRFDIPEIGVAGVGASQPVQDALFPARNRLGGIRTGVAIRNRGATAAEVTCRLLQGGMVLEEKLIPLMTNGQAALFVDELFDGPKRSDFVGSVRCTARDGEEFTGVALEMDVRNRILTTLPMVPVRR